MASAEQYLNEAQYAFTSINSGESRDNRRNAARAKSLCKKIIRKYPTSTEAATAQAILTRMGDTAFVPKLAAAHSHSDVHVSMEKPTIGEGEETVAFNWSGLLSLALNTAMPTLLALGVVCIVLFSIFGPLLLLPLFGVVFFAGPFRQQMKPAQRQKLNEAIARANAYIEKKRRTGS